MAAGDDFLQVRWALMIEPAAFASGAARESIEEVEA